MVTADCERPAASERISVLNQEIATLEKVHFATCEALELAVAWAAHLSNLATQYALGLDTCDPDPLVRALVTKPVFLRTQSEVFAFRNALEALRAMEAVSLHVTEAVAAGPARPLAHGSDDLRTYVDANGTTYAAFSDHAIAAAVTTTSITLATAPVAEWPADALVELSADSSRWRNVLAARRRVERGAAAISDACAHLLPRLRRELRSANRPTTQAA